MHRIRKRYADLKLSSNVLQPIVNSWSKGTQKQYSPNIDRWFDYCTRHNIDPFDSSVCQGEEYFHEGISYSIINVTGSTLCKVFPAENGTPFSKHPFVAKLLRGMFNKRQSLSRYAVTYDVVKVLQYISNSHSQMSSEVWKKFNNINVYFRWTKIPNHELTKYQLYAHIWYFTLHLF